LKCVLYLLVVYKTNPSRLKRLKERWICLNYCS
jgi:hypothetical protein